MKLLSYWRSGSAHRTRIALNIKGLDYDIEAVDLRRGAHKQADFRDKNPQQMVPALILDEGSVLTQSPAILEYIEEAFPTPPLLPSDPLARAKVRAMAAVIGCDTHPLNNMRVLKYQKENYHANEDAIKGWTHHWMSLAFDALEALIERHNSGGLFAHGDAPGLIECYLVPQLYSARRFKLDLRPYKRLTAIDAACGEMTAFQKADPAQQEDAD